MLASNKFKMNMEMFVEAPTFLHKLISSELFAYPYSIAFKTSTKAVFLT